MKTTSARLAFHRDHVHLAVTAYFFMHSLAGEELAISSSTSTNWRHNARLTSCMWCRWTLWWIRRGVMRRSPQPDHSGFSPYEKGASWLSWEGHLVSRGPRGQKLQGDADPGLSHAAQGQAAHYWEQSCCVLCWPSSRPSAFEWICGVGASS